jgi:heme-degrading monooxygenase HmoA
MSAAVRASVECPDDFGSASTVARMLAEGIGNHSAKCFLMRIGADDADRTSRNRPESGLLCCRGFLRRNEVIMIDVFFEVFPAKGRKGEYLERVPRLKSELESLDGLISVERFQSLTDPDKLLSISFWRDEEAVADWRSRAGHRVAILRCSCG